MTSIQSLQIANNATWWGNYTGGGGDGGKYGKVPRKVWFYFFSTASSMFWYRGGCCYLLFFYKQYFQNTTYTTNKHGLANMTFKNKNTLTTPSSSSPRHNDNREPEEYLKHKSTLKRCELHSISREENLASIKKEMLHQIFY